MNFNNYTIRSQEALQKATEVASGNYQQVIETGHLLKGILLTSEDVVSFLMGKLGSSKNSITGPLGQVIESYPKVSGGQPYLSNYAANTLQNAEKYLKEFGG